MIEIQGYGKGHTSYESMKNDYEKMNETLRLSWITIYLMGYQITPETIDQTINYILQIINDRKSGIISPMPFQKQQFSNLIAQARNRLIK